MNRTLSTKLAGDARRCGCPMRVLFLVNNDRRILRVGSGHNCTVRSADRGSRSNDHALHFARVLRSLRLLPTRIVAVGQGFLHRHTTMSPTLAVRA